MEEEILRTSGWIRMRGMTNSQFASRHHKDPQCNALCIFFNGLVRVHSVIIYDCMEAIIVPCKRGEKQIGSFITTTGSRGHKSQADTNKKDLSQWGSRFDVLFISQMGMDMDGDLKCDVMKTDDLRGQDHGHRVVQHTLSEEQSVEIHVDLQLIEDSQDRHCEQRRANKPSDAAPCWME